jgi:hypothetical protein
MMRSSYGWWGRQLSIPLLSGDLGLDYNLIDKCEQQSEPARQPSADSGSTPAEHNPIAAEPHSGRTPQHQQLQQQLCP